ncbi:polysaccharide deacetylase family protein [Paenibacillaceae bacterium]|nr:polysaccharide deacetylase family protein [Paenibacillaceae bacterium]
MENLLLWGFYILTFYAFLPGIISRTFGFRVFKRGQAKREIALTFDDGPDPHYTPLLLDLLAKYDAKATFFVVGANAEKHPELLRRMKAEGHEIGIHNYVHKSNWLMRPKAVKKQIYRTSEIIRQATDTKPSFYRPPWGIVNLFDFANMGYLQIILWSSMFGDWRKRVGVERLTKRMMKKLQPGEVLLLHDCGITLGADQDAPRTMMAALNTYLEEGKSQGYRFVNMTEMIALTDKARSSRKRPMGVMKKTLVRLWLGWEKLFHILFRIQPIDSGQSIFHYRIRPYRGKTLQLKDGHRIDNKDPIIELHFDNKKLFDLMSGSRSLMQMAIQVIREVEKALPKLAAQLSERKELGTAQGLYGISMINRGSESFGFSIIELPDGVFSRMTRFYLKMLIRILHPGGNKRVSDKQTSLVPRIVAMSMEEFRSRYADNEPMSKDLAPKSGKDERKAAQVTLPEEEAKQKAARELVP